MRKAFRSGNWWKNLTIWCYEFSDALISSHCSKRCQHFVHCAHGVMRYVNQSHIGCCKSEVSFTWKCHTLFTMIESYNLFMSTKAPMIRQVQSMAGVCNLRFFAPLQLLPEALTIIYMEINNVSFYQHFNFHSLW